jgi:hypothetical protein
MLPPLAQWQVLRGATSIQVGRGADYLSLIIIKKLSQSVIMTEL